jgi:hypothetical protein
MINLTPLAFGAAINPGMIVLALTQLLGASKPLARAIAFAIGAAATSAIVGLVGLLAATQLNQTAHGSRHAAAGPFIFLGARLLLIVFAVWQALRQPPTKPRRPTEPSPQRTALQRQIQVHAARPVFALLIGAGVMLTNDKGLVLYVVALQHIADAPVGVIASAVAAAFVAITLFGVEIPIVMYVAYRQRAVATLAQVHGWISSHSRLLAISAGMVLGIYLIGRGIVSLVA